MASVMISTFPVRSPFPNSVPSISVCSCKQSKLCIAAHRSLCRYADEAESTTFVTVFQMFVYIFDLCCKNMRHCILNSCRNIDDRLIVCLLAAIHQAQHCTHQLHNPPQFRENFPGCTRKRNYPQSHLPGLFNRFSTINCKLLYLLL